MSNKERAKSRNLEAEKDQVRAEYEQMLENSIAFEKRIRNRWREKNKQKNEQIDELVARLEKLEQCLAEK